MERRNSECEGSRTRVDREAELTARTCPSWKLARRAELIATRPTDCAYVRLSSRPWRGVRPPLARELRDWEGRANVQMPETGLEPARAWVAHQPLKLARLPIPPLRRGIVLHRSPVKLHRSRDRRDVKGGGRLWTPQRPAATPFVTFFGQPFAPQNFGFQAVTELHVTAPLAALRQNQNERTHFMCVHTPANQRGSRVKSRSFSFLY